jgi:hypothetical protein
MFCFIGAIQWFCSPLDAPALLGRFGTIGVVYDRASGLFVRKQATDEPGGREHREQLMEYGLFVAHLRQALVSTGLPEAEAHEYTAHSIRSGAATEAVHAGLPPQARDPAATGGSARGGPDSWVMD